MLIIVKRNIRLYFRDKSGVFFSLLSVLIIIALYALFLKETIKSSLTEIPGIDFLVNSWVIAGILAVASVTTTLGALGVMVNDRCGKIIKDFYSSPVSRSKIVGGYIISTSVIGAIMCFVTLAVSEIYIVAAGGEMLPFADLIELVGLLLLSVVSNSAIIFFIVSFFKSQSAFAAFSIIISTLIGFLTGVYVPVGVLSAPVQFIVKVFPPSHAAVLMREILLRKPMKISFAGAPSTAVDSFKENMGVIYKFSGTTVSFNTSILILIFTTVVFYCLSYRKIHDFTVGTI